MPVARRARLPGRPARAAAAVALVAALVATTVGAGGDPVAGSTRAARTTPTSSTVAPPSTGQGSAPAPVTDRRDERPNIVLISADDMRADELRYMPLTRRRLGAAGLRFTDALTPHPLCCPARAEIMTGQFAQNNGVRSNYGPQGGYGAFDPSRTIGTWLSGAGYNTAFVGKHLNSVTFPDGRDPGWTLFDPTLTGYADYRNFSQYNDGEPRRIMGRYYTDYLGTQSAAYAHELSLMNAPFFLWVSHFGPHLSQDHRKGGGSAPPAVSPSYRADGWKVTRDQRLARERYRELARRPSFDERRIGDKQAFLRELPRVNREKKLTRLIAGRIGALRSVDQAVSHVLDQLERDGELDHTYVAFVTDNGFLLGEHRWVGKTLGYEEALQTPLLVRGPGIRAGGTTDRTVTLVDLAPTFLDIAGAEADLPLDGVSMLDLWRGQARGTRAPHRGGVLVQAGPFEPQTRDRGWYYRGVRTDRYTYLRYFDGFVELYDRARDPFQLASVAGERRYRGAERELARRLERLRTCSGPVACNRGFGGPVPPPRGRVGPSREPLSGGSQDSGPAGGRRPLA